MAIRVEEFSNGGTKLEWFLPKNQHTQRKSLNLRIGFMASFKKLGIILVIKGLKKCSVYIWKEGSTTINKLFTQNMFWYFLFFQVMLQLLFITDAQRRRIHSNDHNSSKPGRQVVTFLLICNITMWIIYTFEVQKVKDSPVQVNNSIDKFSNLQWPLDHKWLLKPFLLQEKISEEIR